MGEGAGATVAETSCAGAAVETGGVPKNAANMLPCAALGEGSGSPILPYPDRSDFPAKGSENVLYIDVGNRRCYCWAADEAAYVAVGSDYSEIGCISGGGAG